MQREKTTNGSVNKNNDFCFEFESSTLNLNVDKNVIKTDNKM
jgi:hypothetical protein